MNSRQIIKLIVGLILLIVFGAFGAWIFQEEVKHYSQLFIDRYGLWGIAIGTLICDTSPFPLTNEPLALIALGSTEPDIPFWKIVCTMSAASHCGAPVGYTCGYFLGQQRWFQTLIQKKYPEVLQKGRPYAVRMVALAAILPIPYAITTWAAGTMQASFWKICLVGSLRWIKTLLTVGAIAGGWMLGQG